MEEIEIEDIKVDKRKQTSKQNMAKARAEKLKQLKEAKELQEYDSSSDDSSSDEEIIIKPKRSKKQNKNGSKLESQVDQLSTIVGQLVALQRNPKKQVKKKIVYVKEQSQPQPKQILKPEHESTINMLRDRIVQN